MAHAAYWSVIYETAEKFTTQAQGQTPHTSPQVSRLAEENVSTDFFL